MARNESERSQILETIRERETSHGVNPVSEDDLRWLRQQLLGLYSATYGESIETPLEILPPTDESSKRIADTIFRDIPRGRFEIQPVVGRYTGEENFTVAFRDSRLFIVHGNPARVDPQRPLGVFKEIISHEMSHEQIKPRSVLGIDQENELANHLGHKDNIAYVLGFKAASVQLPQTNQVAVTGPLEEFTAQYLSMVMLGSFEERNMILERMKAHGRGITAEFITGAEVLRDIINACNITHLEIEHLHNNSDIPGLSDLLDQRRDRLSRRVISSCLGTDFEASVNQLAAVRKYLTGK